MDVAALLAGLYAAGVVIGLFATDARPLTRIGLAVLWPIGPVAFVLTVSFLLVIAPFALIGRR
jgi:hypothetical protein